MKKNLIKTPVLLLAAIILLLASAAGSTQAALIYYDTEYKADLNVSEGIDITLLEDKGNGEAVVAQALNLVSGQLTPGATYTEKLSVKNTGAIDSYVRIVITKSWKGSDGKKATNLSPSYIELHIPSEGSDWVKDKTASTPEREIYYYTKVLPTAVGQEESTIKPVVLTDTFRINPAVSKELIRGINGTGIEYVCKYAGHSCAVEVEVDAVQTHNAEKAIKSAWGCGCCNRSRWNT